MKKRIGILTGGGDCPGLNAVIRGFCKTGISNFNFEMIGILDGFEGLIQNKTTPLTKDKIKGILTRGGTILGTTNRSNPFECPVQLPNGKVEMRDYSEKCVQNFNNLGLDGLLVTGGDGTMTIAHKLYEKGIPFVGVPKTIDNDLDATDYTFGFMTAVDTVTDCIDKLHSTAESHQRIMIVEVMGRDAGWIALYAGIAGGADVILIPEIPFELDKVLDKIKKRQESGSNFSIICIAEGATFKGGEKTYLFRDTLTGVKRLGGIADRLALMLRQNTDLEVRSTVLGHIQRGGTPNAFDRILATRFAVKAAELVEEGKWDCMVALKGDKIVSIPVLNAIDKQKFVSPKSQLVHQARLLDISFGD